MRKKRFTGSAFAAALVLTAGLLTACGDSDGDSDGDSAGATENSAVDDALEAAGDAGLEGSDALQAIQAKAEDYGYKDCMMAPASTEDLSTVMLSCVESNRPKLSLFDKADRESGSEIVESEIDAVMEGAEGAGGAVTREQLGSTYRALDGDDVVGTCDDIGDACDEVAEALGLEASMPEGALTNEEMKKKQREDNERESREYEEKLKKEEEKKQRELQTYSGWDDLDQATEQLTAWQIGCFEEKESKGKVAWCGSDASLVSVGMSADELEDNGVFKNVGRDEMVSVSDGDWVFICAPGAEDNCDTVAEKTGKSVKDGV